MKAAILLVNTVIFFLVNSLTFTLFAQDDQSFRTLTGHRNSVDDVCFSPDGKLLASVGRDMTLRVWNVATGQIDRTAQGHVDYINSVAFSPDGMNIVTGSDDMAVRLWDVGNGNTTQIYKASTGWISSVAISPNSRWVVAGSWDTKVYIWDIETGMLINTLSGHNDKVSSVAFSGDGQFLASASYDKTIKIWNTNDLSLVATLKQHTGIVRAIRFGNRSTNLISAGDDKQIILWNIENQTAIRSFKEHTDIIRDIAYSPDDQLLFSAGDDKLIKIWETSSGICLGTLIGHEKQINALDVEPKGRFMVTASRDNLLKFWSFTDVFIEKHPLANQIKSELATKQLKPRGEFETAEDYEKRKYDFEIAKADIYNKYFERYINQKDNEKNELISRIKNSYSKTYTKIESIGDYNPDQQVFEITIDGKTQYVNIPIGEAPGFKKSWKRAKVTADRQLKDDGQTYEIFNVTISNPETGSDYFFGERKNPRYVDYKVETAEVYNSGTGIPNLTTKIRLIEPSGNNLLDAGEAATLEVVVINEGSGIAKQIGVEMQLKNPVEGLLFDKTKTIAMISPLQSEAVQFDLKAGNKLPTGELLFTINFNESKGFKPYPINITIGTQQYQAARVVFVEAGIRETGNGNSIIENNEIIEVTALVQNKGFGLAQDVKAVVSIVDPNIVCTTPQALNQNMGDLKPGEAKTFKFSFVVNNSYNGTEQLPISVTLSDKFSKPSEACPLGLSMKNVSIVAKDIRIDGQYLEDLKIEDASLTSDVDKNIPQTNALKNNWYALIIGNEDYSTFQKGLTSEINVDFAANDARIFKEYVVNTLGVPERNVKLITNATTAKMNQGTAWLKNLAKVENGNANLIYYYSGHGLPDELTREPYLIPVDVSGKDLAYAIRLSDIYRELAEFPAQRVTVFLDACFSGGARNQPLVVAKTVKIKPKDEALAGNMVVFASSSGEESSSFYREKLHGLFTYFLLKCLQETGGNVTYKYLADYITKNVTREAVLVNEKDQTPKVNVSAQVKDVWEEWYMNR